MSDETISRHPDGLSPLAAVALALALLPGSPGKWPDMRNFPYTHERSFRGTVN